MTNQTTKLPTTIKATQTIRVPNGHYKGTVVDVERDVQTHNGTEMDYTRVDVQIEGTDMPVLAVSFPSTISEGSALGKLIQEITGEKLVVDAEYDTRDLLMGKALAFTVKNQPSKKNPSQSFANIVRESVIPA